MENTLNAESTPSSTQEPSAGRVILVGSLIAGTLDISSAFVHSAILGGRGPIGVLQGIASGLLGQNSFNGGLPAAALGLAIHFFIATVACTLYYAASRKLTFMVRRAILSGALYGVVVWVVMYLIVRPITFHRGISYPFSLIVTAILIHIAFVGLPIALTVRWYSKLQQ